MNNVYPQMSSYYPQQRMNSYPVSNSIIWVQGIEGAKAYQVSPNSIIQLMDSENDGIFYIKSSDNIGMSTLRVFQYKEIEPTQKSTEVHPDLSEYVRKDELKGLIANLTAKQEENNEQTISTTQSKHKSTIK